MIFAFVEDGTLEILDDADAARRAYEGVDVEAGAVSFYDALGKPLTPYFRIPNRAGRMLGLLAWPASGVFDLVPDVAGDRDPFALALAETVALAPNRWFSSLENLKDTLRASGVVVDQP